MAVALTALQKKNVYETYKRVQSMRETCALTKRSKNTVRAILKEYKPDNLTINQAMTASENKKKFNEMPVINPESKWNPLQSEVYRRLTPLDHLNPVVLIT